MSPVNPKLRQVWYSKSGAYKFIVRHQEHIADIKRDRKNYIFIAHTPHSETSNEYGGIFSYTCDSEWCRCWQ